MTLVLKPLANMLGFKTWVLKPGPPPAKRVGFMILVLKPPAKYAWFQDLGLETPAPPSQCWFHDPGLETNLLGFKTRVLKPRPPPAKRVGFMTLVLKPPANMLGFRTWVLKPRPPPAKRVGFMTLVLKPPANMVGFRTWVLKPRPPPSQEGWLPDLEPGFQDPSPEAKHIGRWFQDQGHETTHIGGVFQDHGHETNPVGWRFKARVMKPTLLAGGWLSKPEFSNHSFWREISRPES